jgi:hypothetical protein
MAYWRSPPFMPSPQHRVRLHDLGSDYRLSSRSAARRRIVWGMEIVHAHPDAIARRTSRFNHESGPEICFRGWAVAGIWGPHCLGGPERSPSSHGPLDGHAYYLCQTYDYAYQISYDYMIFYFRVILPHLVRCPNPASTWRRAATEREARG